MIYLDAGATSFPKPPEVIRAVERALQTCANPGRGGYGAAAEAARQVYECRAAAGRLFDCRPEQVALTTSCTHGLNIAIGTLVPPGGKVLISGFEHNAVTRPLHARKAKLIVAGRRLFDWADILEDFERGLTERVDAAVFTHVSNVFGYVLPVEQMSAMCRERGIPFVIDAAQSAGSLPVSMERLGADFIAMPGHKGLLGPQGTGLLLCKDSAEPLLYGGTGSASLRQEMPEELPDRLEPGTLNVPGYAGLRAGLEYLNCRGIETIFRTEHRQLKRCVHGLRRLGLRVFAGEHQAATVSVIPEMDCEEAAERLSDMGVAVRAGLHCAPLAHQSAGTVDTGTLRVSFGHRATDRETEVFLRVMSKLHPLRK